MRNFGGKVPILRYFVLIPAIHQPMFKVTLHSTPVSSELPCSETTLLRKQLISPMLFDQSKSSKEDAVLIGSSVFAIDRYVTRNVSFQAGPAKLFFKTSS